MRNPNGFGGVYKLAGNRRKPYVARITVDWTYEGKQVYKNLGTYSNYKDAIQALTDYHFNPYNLDAANITFSELYDNWTKIKYNKISKSMMLSYKNAYRACESLHNLSFTEIKRPVIQSLINDCGKSYSGKERIKMLISQLFDYAIENDIITKNYCNYIELGERPDKTLTRIPFSKEEIELLYSSLHLYRYTDTILMMIFSGVRPSELLLIETKNVFLDENYFICGIKTSNGKNRKVPISSFTKPFFTKYYNEAIKSNSPYLIVNTEGSNMKYSNYNRDKFHKIMEQLEMKHMPHDARHTFATFMSKCEADKLCTQLIMGHSPKVLIDKTYVHKTVEDLQIELQKLENIFDLNKMMSLISDQYFKNDYEFLTFNSIDNWLKRKCS